MTTVTVVGDALLDVHVVPAELPRPGGDVPAEIRLEPGGQGANVAVRLARRGVSVRLACAIGTDAAGDLLRERLSADGVELVDLGAPATGAVVVLLDSARERTMLSQRVPFAARLPAAALADSAWLVVSGYLLRELEAGVSATGDAPCRALLGCSLGPAEVGRWREAAAFLAPHLVILNADEARAVGAEMPGAVVVVTTVDGATATVAGRVVSAPATAGSEVVDTTGAGDAFAAGLIAELAESDWPPDARQLGRAMAAAAELAAAVTRVRGAQTRVVGERPA